MKKVIMVIIDGFGISEKEEGNAIKQVNMDCFNELYSEYPHSILKASGESVGLLDDQYGNSTVGHLTIGAGKKVKQDVSLCNEILGSTLIEKNEKLINLINETKEKGGRIHLMGMVSDGGVHSDITYIKNLLHHLKEMGARNISFHLITDGKDTKEKEAVKFIKEITDELAELNLGKISTICGRYYAMDRDEHYERTKVYTDLVLNAKGVKIRSYERGVEACYNREITDEFLVPIILDENGTIKDNDSLIWLNFRADRSKQILNALTNPEFDRYRIKQPANLKAVSLLPIDEVNNVDYLLEGKEQVYSLGMYLSDLGLRQARIAEKSKYNYVTYYFNGGEKEKVKGCDNYKIDSNIDNSFDIDPKMNLDEVTKQTIKCIEKDYDFILVNIANPDVVGHTGNIEATKESLVAVDESLRKIIEAVDDNFYKLIVTSDHGNVEEMIKEDETKQGNTVNPVPFIIRDKHVQLKHKGDITQIAPTILKYMDIAIPKQMKETKTLFNDED